MSDYSFGNSRNIFEEAHKSAARLKPLSDKENNQAPGTTIGVNESGVDQDLIIGKVIGAYDSEEQAKAVAVHSSGSEIIYKKENTWYLAELKEKDILGDNKSEISKGDWDNIVLDKSVQDKKGMAECSISFLEDDFGFKTVTEKIIDAITPDVVYSPSGSDSNTGLGLLNSMFSPFPNVYNNFGDDQA